MKSHPSFDFKAGTTFNPVCTFQQPSGTPADISLYTIASQIRTKSGTIVATLTAVQLSGLGQFTFLPTSTDLWPIQPLLWDILFYYSGQQFYTQTAQINMIQYQTSPVL